MSYLIEAENREAGRLKTTFSWKRNKVIGN